MHFEWTNDLRFVVAVMLGLLVGLERERVGAEQGTRIYAGIRTYAIISMFGYATAYLHRIGVSFALPAGLVTLAALVLTGYLAKLRDGRVGWTSEISALLTFAVGALSLLADIWIPMALAIINTLLLSEKSEIEPLVEKLDKTEFLAVLRFLLVTVIVLPALPDQDYTRFQLNPTRVWQTVIMVSSIGFVGYFLVKRFGERHGLRLSGLLGGVVSSTAVSLAMGRHAATHPAHGRSALQSSLLASSVMYARILVLIGILNPSLIPTVWLPLTILAVVGIVLSFAYLHGDSESDPATTATLKNPFEIKPALIFAFVFVLLSIITRSVKDAYGGAGLLGLSAIVGVTDIDPFILGLVQAQDSVNGLAAVAIVLATLSNTVAKGVYFGVLATSVRKETMLRYALWALAHGPVLWLATL